MTTADLDPAFAAAVAEYDSFAADWIAGDPVALRAAYAEARKSLLPDVAPDCDITPFEAGRGAGGLLFRPRDASASAQSDQAIVHFHGGSWLVGGPDTHEVPCSHLAVESGLPVFSFRYRLAPEHRFPAQREDGVAAATALLEGGVAELPAPRQIILAGDSAGAAVAFWVSMAPTAICRRERRANSAAVCRVQSCWRPISASVRSMSSSPHLGSMSRRPYRRTVRLATSPWAMPTRC